jgi:site-specific DNA recombinase
MSAKRHTMVTKTKNAVGSAEVRYLLYARKSTDREDKQLYSINDQINICKKIATERGITIVEIIEESRSAKTAGNRPAFQAMVKRIRSGEIGGIITWHPDRLARNAVDGGWIMDMLDQKILKDLIFASGYNFDNTPEGKFMLSMIFSQAKYYTDKLSHEVTEKFIVRREAGQWLSLAPEGYLNYRDPVTGRKSVIEDPERFPILQKAFDLILIGMSPLQVLSILNDKWGYRCRPYRNHPARFLTPKHFYRVLENPFYMGQCRFEDTTYPGVHPKMITAAEFEKVQHLLGRSISSNRRRTHDFLFTGRIRCGQCGAMITASLAKGNVYYHCTNMKKICDRKGVRENEIEENILSVLSSLEVPQPFVDFMQGCIQASTPRILESDEATRKRLQEAMKRKEDALQRLLDLRLEGLLTNDEFQDKRSSLQAEIATLDAEKQQTGESMEVVTERATKFLSLASQSHQAYLAGPTEAKRSILSQVVQSMKLVPKTGELIKPNQTKKKLLLEPFPEFEVFLQPISQNGIFKPVENGSGKSKKTSQIVEVPSGGPDVPLIKLLERGSLDEETCQHLENIVAKLLEVVINRPNRE